MPIARWAAAGSGDYRAVPIAVGVVTAASLTPCMAKKRMPPAMKPWPTSAKGFCSFFQNDMTGLFSACSIQDAGVVPRDGCRFTWPTRSSFGLEYRVRAEASPVGSARVVADGESTQVMFDLERSRVMRVPADLLELFEGFEQRAIPRR